MQHALEFLQKYFGYSEFHPMQQAIINDVLDDRDVFVLMPTGSGKSLCYQLPALMKQGVAVVVSPLIALMKDQVDMLRENGIGAAFINSTLTPGEIEDIKARVLAQQDRILYVAPERFASADFLQFLRTLTVSLFAVDEAHCISEWGHDFRPEYRRLSILKEQFPRVPVIALTASAVSEAQRDIIRQLKLVEPNIYKASFDRPNLSYFVRPKEDAYGQIVRYIRQRPRDSGIIYCQSRNTTERLAEKLQREGFRALPYHAGMPADARAGNHERFIRDDADIIVATVAFGMGIHKTNIRYVIHHDLPKNLESYYQETGRAGRDRLESDCILFFSYGDRKKIEALIETSPNPSKKRAAYRKLGELIRFCEGTACRRKMLLRYFGEEYGGRCGKCDTCLEPPETFDGTEAARTIVRCVQETGQRFGAVYIASLLAGTGGAKAAAYHHHRLASYGAGKEYTAKQWVAFIRELASRGYLDIAGDKYPVLKINQRSSSVMAGTASVVLAKPAGKKVADLPQASEPDTALFEALRALRKRIADIERVPPYVVFHDATLRELAARRPQDAEHMGHIRGIGQAKLAKYGNAFLRAIRMHGIALRGTADGNDAREAEPDTVGQTRALCRQGMTLDQIATARHRAPSTIASHIERLLAAGEDIDISAFVSEEKQRAIEERIRSAGGASLALLKEQLGTGYSYEEIQIVRGKLNGSNGVRH